MTTSEINTSEIGFGFLDAQRDAAAAEYPARPIPPTEAQMPDTHVTVAPHIAELRHRLEKLDREYDEIQAQAHRDYQTPPHVDFFGMKCTTSAQLAFALDSVIQRSRPATVAAITERIRLVLEADAALINKTTMEEGCDALVRATTELAARRAEWEAARDRRSIAALFRRADEIAEERDELVAQVAATPATDLYDLSALAKLALEYASVDLNDDDSASAMLGAALLREIDRSAACRPAPAALGAPIGETATVATLIRPGASPASGLSASRLSAMADPASSAVVDDVTQLPFVTARAGARDSAHSRGYWAVKPTGTYAADCEVGEAFGLEYLRYIERGKMLPLQWIVRDMGLVMRTREIGGVEIGFLTIVQIAASGGLDHTESMVANWQQQRSQEKAKRCRRHRQS